MMELTIKQDDESKTVEAQKVMCSVKGSVGWVDDTSLNADDADNIEVRRGPELSDTMYLIQRHNDDYHGPHQTEVARNFETAIDIMRDMIDELDADGWSWEMLSADPDTGRLCVSGNRCRVVIKEKPVHD